MDTTDSSNMNGTTGPSSNNHTSAPSTPTPTVMVSVMPTSASSNENKPGDGKSTPGPAPVLQFQVTPNVQVVNASPAGTSSYSMANANSSQNYYNEPSGFALSDFLMQLEDYTPTIPDAVANYFLHQAGFDSTDPRMSRLISVAAQKFISDIINESFTHCKLKGAAQVGKQKTKDKKYVLTLDDLVPVLNDYGITVRKPPYYV